MAVPRSFFLSRALSFYGATTVPVESPDENVPPSLANACGLLVKAFPEKLITVEILRSKHWMCWMGLSLTCKTETMVPRGH